MSRLNFILVGLVLLITGLGSLEGECSEPGIVEFPLSYTVGKNCQVYLEESGSRVNKLDFSWNQDNNSLYVNGVKIFPPTREEEEGTVAEKLARRHSEESLEENYGGFPYIVKLHKKLGSWADAVGRYYEEKKKFEQSLIELVLNSRENGSSDKEISPGISRKISESPFSEFYFANKVTIEEEKIVLFSKMMGKGPVRKEISLSRGRENNVEISGDLESAKDLVRNIIGFLNSRPSEPHMLFLGNGGMTAMLLGEDVVSKAQAELADALETKSLKNMVRFPRGCAKKILENK